MAQGSSVTANSSPPRQARKRPDLLICPCGIRDPPLHSRARSDFVLGACCKGGNGSEPCASVGILLPERITLFAGHPSPTHSFAASPLRAGWSIAYSLGTLRRLCRPRRLLSSTSTNCLRSPTDADSC